MLRASFGRSSQELIVAARSGSSRSEALGRTPSASVGGHRLHRNPMASRWLGQRLSRPARGFDSRPLHHSLLLSRPRSRGDVSMRTSGGGGPGRRLRVRERLVEVRDQVLGGLEPDRRAKQAGADAAKRSAANALRCCASSEEATERQLTGAWQRAHSSSSRSEGRRAAPAHGSPRGGSREGSCLIPLGAQRRC